MRPPRTASFRNRLFAALLAASLIPLLICSAMLLQIFRLRINDQAPDPGPGRPAAGAADPGQRLPGL